jgi:hypothetical protein
VSLALKESNNLPEKGGLKEKAQHQPKMPKTSKMDHHSWPQIRMKKEKEMVTL